MKNWVFGYFQTLDAKLKIVFAVLGLVILAEVIWAIFSLTRPFPAPIQQDAQNSTPAGIVSETSTPTQAEASIRLTGPPSYVVGSVVKLDIRLSSSDATDGVDVILKYDPKILEIVPVDVAGKKAAVQLGALYKEYPTNEFDEVRGLVFVSGLTAPNSKGFSGEEVLGSVSFKVLKNGASRVDVEFSPDSTKDSNVISTETGKDILIKAEGLNIVAK